MASRKETERKSSGRKRAAGQQGSERAQPDRRSTGGARESGRQNEETVKPQSWEGRSEWAGSERTGQWGQERGDGGSERRGDREQRVARRGEGGGRQAGPSRGALQHWSPFQEMGRAFGFGPLFSHPLFSRTLSSFEEFMPSTDVYLDGRALVVKADLPGMSRDDVDVCIENGDLVVSGERRHESEVDERNVYRSERAYGSFYRRVPLPQGADAEHVEARFRDGVLEVKVPLREETPDSTRRIEIR
jgi:HSP20 family protein